MLFLLNKSAVGQRCKGEIVAQYVVFRGDVGRSEDRRLHNLSLPQRFSDRFGL